MVTIGAHYPAFPRQEMDRMMDDVSPILLLGTYGILANFLMKIWKKKEPAIRMKVLTHPDSFPSSRPENSYVYLVVT